MLAFLSDLHFCDGTGLPGNVSPQLFELALGEIYEQAARVARRRGRPTHLDLVLLGDIFDLLRTERWFKDRHGAPVPLEERPWATAAALTTGGVTPLVAARARAILEEAVAESAASLAIVRGEALPPPPGVEVRRIFIPGNHDRLFLLDPELRRGMLDALGAVSGDGAGEGIFLHRLEMPDYGVLARHGHEWDMWNFPRYRGIAPSGYTDADYTPTPIGDPVTTEMAARLPYELRRRLLDTRVFSAEDVAGIHRRMKRIDDVRPLMASFHWAYDEVERLSARMDSDQARELDRALGDTFRTIARDFRDLEFYKAWEARQFRELRLTRALVLRSILCGLSVATGELRILAGWLDRLFSRFDPRDRARSGAARERLGPVGAEGMRFVVYGHTHAPTQVAIHARVRTKDVYLNSGTYRPGVFRTDDGRGFVGWQRLAYTCVFGRDETAAGRLEAGPGFTAWIGAATERGALEPDAIRRGASRRRRGR